MVALTLNKGMAYDGIRSPVSHRERRGFAFDRIPIRYPNTDLISYSNMISDQRNDCIVKSFLG